MFSSAEEVLRFIAEESVEFVDVRFCDLPGTMQHFTVPAGSFGEGVFSEGLMFDGSSIRGFQQIHESDMQLLPDPATAYVDPFRAHKTLNLTSMNSTFSSAMKRRTSSALLNINVLFLVYLPVSARPPRLRPRGPR